MGKPFALLALTPLMAVVSGCEGPIAKENPTWEADVYPILRGQCLHCHGETANENGKTQRATKGYRFDLINLDACRAEIAAAAKMSSQFLPGGFGASSASDNGKRPRMPPPPATPLEDWEVQTLKNWEKEEGFLLGKHPGGNQKPKIIITSEYPDKVGDELKVSYRFEDADGDPVIGVLKFGDAKVDLLKFSGQVTLTGFTAASGDTLTLSAELCDGWDSEPVDIKDIEKE